MPLGRRRAGKKPSEDRRNISFLVYGQTGWIGGLVGRYLKESCFEYNYGSGRLHDRASLERDIKFYEPTHIINAAGLTGRPNVDWCESHKREVVQTNVLGVLNLVDVAKTRELHVTNFATGCIYNYDDVQTVSGAGFSETDVPNFTGSYYSKTKVIVEELLKEYDNVLQLRLRMPIDENLQNPRNFIHKIATYSKVVNVPNSMSVLTELVPLAVQAAVRGLTGTYNFTNPGVISHNEVLELYKKYCDNDFTWVNFSLAEQSQVLAAPRSNNRLNTSKLEKEFPGLLDVKTSLVKHVFEVNKGVKIRRCDGKSIP